jgi:preprotein translocase subunit SecG
MGSRSQGEHTNHAPGIWLTTLTVVKLIGGCSQQTPMRSCPRVTTEESVRDAGTISVVLTWIVGALHLSSAFGLVGLVLLHSGKGGGVSDMFGGSVGATAAGSTVAEKNLSRITVVVAVTFGFTTLVLGLLLA